MKIFSAELIRSIDSCTIKSEPVSSINLMERAAGVCVDWITKNIPTESSFQIICGTGNNGGDGLAIARMLAEKKFNVEIIILGNKNTSDDFLANKNRVASKSKITELKEGDKLSVRKDWIIIDSIFGTGLKRPVTGWFSDCIEAINKSGNKIISIDLPSGLFADEHTSGSVIRASVTLTFQFQKLAFLFPENENYCGDVYVLDIGLNKDCVDKSNSDKFYVETSDITSLLKKRNKFSHKGNNGHALLIAGSRGKGGAAVLASRACLRTGCGLLTVHVPGSLNEIMQISTPEAMTDIDVNEEFITAVDDVESFDVVGIGPGIGKHADTRKLLKDFLERMSNPVVLDADALNILAEHPEKMKLIPANSILTPHLKEFERLAGRSENNFDRHAKQIEFSKTHNVIVVLKGANTCITMPDGRAYFNSTGNPGMAKGGSGDILTGMILSLLAQKYTPEHAAILGVYLHGLAGDIAAAKKGMDGMIAGDIVRSIPVAFQRLRNK